MPEKEFVILWERMANSGVIQSCRADSAKEAVKNCGYSTKFVKHTVIEKVPNSKIEIFGEMG